MRRIGSALLAVSMLVGCGAGSEAGTTPSESGSTTPSAEQQQQAPLLTTTNVDVATECTGILEFANTASYTLLDRYLPSNVVTNIVNRRATAPFTSLADLSSVPLVGPARLKQLEGGARTLDFIDADCVGIMDGIAISHDDQDAIVALVNSISDSELHDVLPNAWNGAVNLLNARNAHPFTTAQQIADTAGIGDVSFRNIRNSATLSRPLEALFAAINAVSSNGDYGATALRHFDWWNIAIQDHHYRDSKECFGLEPSSVPYGATIRPNLATAAEVRAAVESAYHYARGETKIPDAVRDAGLANLDALTQGRSFKGCILTYENDPWSRNTVHIYVDTTNGFSVMTETWWAE
ncbi:helix-hairpin-helix domain-containing protein [Corallococcus sp. EGB]|uniref:helix-hairpin-helix domain-containing protein n=1 Tax=Corallococcus sp. EGB TaxID=1521117 RepID=UPI001CBA6C0E|nr:helix-hairpin-helix domain-containing protein [Corallococcus sp. EGB]